MADFDVTFKKVDSSDALRGYAEKRTGKLRKLVAYPLAIHVVLSLEKKTDQCAELLVHAERKELVAKATAKDMYEAIDLAVHKMEMQIKKERERKKGHGKAHEVARANGRLGKDVPADLPHQGKVRK